MFDFFMPLGWFCGTTSSMSKYGLRELSGPFDWNFSEIEGVIHFLDTDFSDFLTRENLEVVRENPRRFRDRRWGVLFVHEVNWNFEEEYEAILEKHKRRNEKIERRLDTGSVCFIRAVKEQSEVEYIVQNETYIKQVIKKKNPENEIIFLLPKFISIPKDFPFRYFALNINVYQGNYRESLRGLFDSNPEFINYLQTNYSIDKIKTNKAFDAEKELRADAWDLTRAQIERIAMEDVDTAYRKVMIAESKCNSLAQIARCNFEKTLFPEKIVLYGADEVGKVFYDKVKEKSNIAVFLDQDSEEESYDGIPILRPENYVPDGDITVVFTFSYEKEEKIKRLITLWGQKASFCDMIELLTEQVFLRKMTRCLQEKTKEP